MNDSTITMYQTSTSHMIARFSDGKLDIESCVYGDDDYPDSEKHYIFNEEQLEKLLSVISFEKLMEKCQKGLSLWLEEFLEKNNLEHEEKGI